MADEEEELEVELSDGEDEHKGSNSEVCRVQCMLAKIPCGRTPERDSQPQRFVSTDACRDRGMRLCGEGAAGRQSGGGPIQEYAVCSQNIRGRGLRVARKCTNA